MKKWLLYAFALVVVAALGYMPFSGSDVADLQPVELIYVKTVENGIEVRTDTGDLGRGEILGQAFADLKATAVGEVFLDTADFLLIHQNDEALLQELTGILRPACNVCVIKEEIDMKAAAAYLRTGKTNVTLQQIRTGQGSAPLLILEEGRMYLAWEEG